MVTFLAMAGVAALNTVTNVVAEAFIDTTVDFVIDGVDEIMQKAMPNFNNKYVKQFTNQVRMGVAVSTNARIMGGALKSQNMFEQKMDVLREESRSKYLVKKKEIKGSVLKMGGKSEAIKNLEKNYYKEMEHLNQGSNRYTNIRSSSATEASAFSVGTGALKTGHDGTIQNLKGNPNADLVVSINRLLNGLGNYPDKEGVLKI
ncbi:hypothetical protein [Psychrilyobacter atlanticus]|uniref:hypothetical protein n=1 Tax=Psychrilyobacter atlanticus TaxID=271091 RepID=UPI00040D0348|nr:hypothetical protein [Psychrilyobacter atlanticus]